MGYINSRLVSIYGNESNKYKISKIFIFETLLKSTITILFLIFSPSIFEISLETTLKLNTIYILALITYGITLITTVKGLLKESILVSIFTVHIFIYVLMFTMKEPYTAFYWAIFLLVPFLSTWFYLGNTASMANIMMNLGIVLTFPWFSSIITYQVIILFLIFYITICGLVIFTGFYYNKTQEELERILIQNQELQKVEALGRLTGGVAHDFNNLLTTIYGYSELISQQLDDNDPSPEIHKYLEQIVNTVEIASSLIDQLLEYSKNKITKKEVISLDRFLLKIKPILKTTLISNIDLRLDLNAKNYKIRANKDQLLQMFLNLTFNAIEAMPKGGKYLISTHSHKVMTKMKDGVNTLSPGNYIHLKISDNGVGISKDALSKIFDPFYTTKTKSTGSGLGLSTVYGIVKQAKGGITVESRLGQGTTFNVYFPESVTT